jgi:thiamine pyrophosphate-dependent acetolactate synthase large subunit-like protein
MKFWKKKSDTTSKDLQADVSRREFLTAATATGLATASLGQSSSEVQAQESRGVAAGGPGPVVPTEEQEAQEFDGYTSEQVDRYFVKNPASDFMVDVIKSLNIDYIATNPGSSFRGIQESIVNYAGNSKPELLTVNHEEIACCMAHGYFKGSGSEKVMGILAHGTVGLAHTPMAVYNAFCDRAPMIIIAGNHIDAGARTPGGTNWWHSAQDMPKILRDFTKWDDTCHSLTHFADSMARAYQIATTPPMGPVVIVVDADQQEEEMPMRRPQIHRRPERTAPHADANAVREIAQWLVEAELPVITAGRMAHNQKGTDLLVELAELLQAGVSNSMGRMNFPNTHHLSVGSGAIGQADVVLGLEVGNPGRTRQDAKVITLGTAELFLKTNFQHFGRYYAPDLAVAGDAQATLPALIEEVRRLRGKISRSALEKREDHWRETHLATRRQDIENARHGWDASPVSTSRLYGELWQVVKNKDWAMVSNDGFQSSWGKRLWPMTKYHHFHGSSGAAGIGYGAPAAVGAALAHKEHGRFVVNVQKDGDLMFSPGVLWTAAHHKIPMLNVMHNNRAYHAERMIVQRVANARNRGTAESSRIGNTIDNPAIDFAKVADGLGMWSTGPVTDPNDLHAALVKAVAVVESGEPCLVDVLCSGR